MEHQLYCWIPRIQQLCIYMNKSLILGDRTRQMLLNQTTSLPSFVAITSYNVFSFAFSCLWVSKSFSSQKSICSLPPTPLLMTFFYIFQARTIFTCDTRAITRPAVCRTSVWANVFKNSVFCGITVIVLENDYVAENCSKLFTFKPKLMGILHHETSQRPSCVTNVSVSLVFSDFLPNEHSTFTSEMRACFLA